MILQEQLSSEVEGSTALRDHLSSEIQGSATLRSNIIVERARWVELHMKACQRLDQRLEERLNSVHDVLGQLRGELEIEHVRAAQSKAEAFEAQHEMTKRHELLEQQIDLKMKLSGELDSMAQECAKWHAQENAANLQIVSQSEKLSMETEASAALRTE